MTDLQREFRKFNDEISLERDREKATLAEKRARILDRLKDGIKKQRATGTEIPSYDVRNQGSYAMGTGIKPLDGDYDLDVALVFELSTTEYPDPVEVKRWVFDALDGHTKEVRVREPCVTVFYQRQGEPVYHVDLAVYADEDDGGGTQLARGKLGSSERDKKWEPADPEGLLEAIQGRFTDDQERQQFKRAIKYLKRWKDVQFSSEGNEAPKGIALTACAYRWFSPSIQVDQIASTTTEHDLAALLGLVREMLARFGSRLTVTLPVPPGNDLFERMSDTQMGNMKAKLQALRDCLEKARDDVDPHEAARTLAGALGDDFPIPDKSDTGVKRAAAIVTSGHSA